MESDSVYFKNTVYVMHLVDVACSSYYINDLECVLSFISLCIMLLCILKL